MNLTSYLFSFLSSQDEFKRVIFVLEDAILATDLAIYFRRRSETFAVIDDGALDWGSDAHRSLLRGMMMTGCDLSAITKPWPIQQKERYLMKSIRRKIWRANFQSAPPDGLPLEISVGIISTKEHILWQLVWEK